MTRIVIFNLFHTKFNKRRNFSEAEADTVYIKTDLGEIGSVGVKWIRFV